MKIQYKDRHFSPSSLTLIDFANSIIDEYAAQGYSLTLRQLYYQFVARDMIQNTVRDYKALGEVVNNARLAGLIDWDSIEDRTRNLRRLTCWQTPAEMVHACAEQFHIDLWEGQDIRMEVWVEKEALAGVVQRAAQERDVAWFCCRGYTSQSEMHVAALRLLAYIHCGLRVIVVHLGDHDPSGIDMSRDIESRIAGFLNRHLDGEPGWFSLERIALNMVQIVEFKPPPNPAKTTDSRFRVYRDRYGSDSWELDAMEPSYLHRIILETIDGYLDPKIYRARQREEAAGRRKLKAIARGQL